MVTVAALFAVAIGPVCLILGFDTPTPVKSGNRALFSFSFDSILPFDVLALVSL